MRYYLGIDGGGTKTTCAVGDESHAIAIATAGASNIVRVGEVQTRESLQQAVRQACAAAGINPAQVARACIGGSGAGHPELAEKVRGFLAEILPGPIDVVGDMQIALEAAFDGGPGVIVIAGTGSIAYGRNQQGTSMRAGGWGFGIGDEGSAHWIGRAAVSAVLRAADPRPADVRPSDSRPSDSGIADSRKGISESDPPADSSLCAALFKAWGVRSIADLARAGNAIPAPDFSMLFPAVAASSDAVAAEVLNNAGRELANVAGVITRRLFAVDHTGAVPVAMIGGVFRHAPIVRRVFYNELRAMDPRVDVNPEVVDPVEGALRMARKVAAKESK